MNQLNFASNLYREAFRRYLRGDGEEALIAAYQAGRTILREPSGILYLVEFHSRALAELHDKQDAIPFEEARRAAEFLRESMSPFEMLLRGVVQTNEQLQEYNRELEAKVVERTAELRAIEARFRGLVERSPAIVYTMFPGVPPDIDYVSPKVEALLGVPARDWSGENWLDRVHEEDLPRLEDALRDADEFGRLEVEYRIRTEDDRWIWLHDYAERTERHTDGRFHGVATDVTERRELEESLRHGQKMQVVGQLAGGVAHDFNNLLAIITSFGQLVQTSLPEDAPQREDMDEILEAADRASELTRQLLTFSRRGMTSMEVFDLNDCYRDSEKMIRGTLGERIELDVSLEEGLWPVRADRREMQQVLLNLAANARDALTDGGRVTIRTTDRNVSIQQAGRSNVPPGEWVVLEFADDGVGMEVETARRAFEPFFTTKPDTHGTGLGLSTCYGIVRAADGHMRVESTLGDGTTFRIYLPRAESHLDASTAASDETTSGGTETILLVEDEDGVRRAARRILTDLGYRVLCADDAADALDLLDWSDDPPELLVTDVIMPGMTGRQLHEHLERKGGRLPVLYVSGFSGNELSRQAGLDDPPHFLQKPFSYQDLAGAVREALNDREQ